MRPCGLVRVTIISVPAGEGAAEKTRTTEKRDRVADFIHFCEGMAELAKAEPETATYLLVGMGLILFGIVRSIRFPF
jgi:hypothetical protein